MTECPVHPVDLGWYRCEEQGEEVWSSHRRVGWSEQ